VEGPAAGVSAGTAERRPTRPFVGRAQELKDLDAGLAEATDGRGSLVLLAGEPGIGKTRLMAELGRRAADRDVLVVTGRCWEEGGAPPYWPWIQVIRSLGGDLERLAAATAPAGDRRPVGVVPQGDRLRLFDDVARLLSAAAEERPVLLTLDDVHAADEPSLLMLRFLGDALARSRVLVVASYRETERRLRHLAPLFAELARVGRRVALRGLTPAELAAYVTTVTGTPPAPETVTRLSTVTGGNPFFLGEVVRLLAAPEPAAYAPAGRDPLLQIPEEVRVLIRRRVAALSREAGTVLRIASVTGREFDLPVLQAASRIPTLRLVALLREAAAAGLLIDLGGAAHRHSFAHELVRETLYDDLTPGRRFSLHRDIGRLLVDLHGDDLGPHLSEVARHLALAAPVGNAAEAVDYLVRAGHHAAKLFAYEEATAHYLQALDLLPLDNGGPARRSDLLLRLGEAQWRAGDGAQARTTYEQAIELARRTGDGDVLARAALGYVTALGGFLLYARFEVGGTGVRLLEEALAVLPRQDSSLRALLMAHLALEMWSGNEPVDLRMTVSQDAIDMARRLGDSEALGTALHARHWALTTPGMARERLAQTEEMLHVATETRDATIEFLAHNARFHCFLELCDRRGMEAESLAMSELAARLRQPFYRWHTVCLQTLRATLDGRFADAERFPWIPRWRDALAAADLGDRAAARRELDTLGGDVGHLSRDGLWVLHLCALAETCVLAGDRRRAHQLYTALLPRAQDNAVSYTQQPFGPVALRLGQLAVLLGRWQDAEEHFSTALARCELLGARAIRIRVLLEHAAALAARREPADRSRLDALLGEADALCQELGTPELAARVADLRRSCGEPETAVFRREGATWTLAYGGTTVRLPDLKGLHYLRQLLRAPGREVHVLELVQAVEGVPGRPATAADDDLAETGAGTIPLLDAQAKAAYRRRLHELAAELAEARDWADTGRVERLEDEAEALRRELARAVGLGGRDRSAPTPAERARVSVTKSVRAAIKAIDRCAPSLGQHLADSVRTGRMCVYAPPAAAPPRWTV